MMDWPAGTFHALVAAAMSPNASQPGQLSVVTQPLDLDLSQIDAAAPASAATPQHTGAEVVVEPVEQVMNETGVSFVALASLSADEAAASNSAIRVGLNVNSERSVRVGVCVPLNLEYARVGASADQVRIKGKPSRVLLRDA